MVAATIKLSQKYEAHGVTFDTVTLREPTGADYWALGPVAEWQPAGDGMALITFHDVLKSYAERLLVVPEGSDATGMLAVIALADTLKIAKSVKDFFSIAVKSNEPETS